MPTSHPIHRQITLAIVISAIAVPAASARPNPAPKPTAQNQTTPAGVVVRPNPDQQIGPSTLVRPNPDQQIGHSGSGAHHPNSPGAGGASVSTLKAIANASAADPAAVAPPAITAPSDDFDFGAAALGAGITAAIAVLIAAGTVGLRQHSRTRHP